MNKQRSFIRPSLAIVLFAFTALGFAQIAEGNEERAAAQYRTCAACHGLNGEGGIGPNLMGRTPEYVLSRLISYRNGEMVGPQSSLMWGQVAQYTAEDLQGLAEYVSRLRPTIED